jgi:hypothetical protein
MQQNVVFDAIIDSLQTVVFSVGGQVGQPIRYRYEPEVRRITIQLMATEKPPRGDLARQHSWIKSRRRRRDH